MNMNSHVKMKTQTEWHPGCLGEQVDEMDHLSRVNSKTTCCWLRGGEEAAPVRSPQQTGTELSPQREKRSGECAWLGEDVGPDIHQRARQRGCWRAEIQSFLSVLLGSVGNLTGLICEFPQIPSYH